MKARLITLEGGEGAGKSSAMAAISATLGQAGIDIVSTREPGGSQLAEAIRELLLSPSYDDMPAISELLMMFAARADHLAKVILPALQQGRWVLCDRFIDASYAYQGGGRGLARSRIATLEQWVLGSLRPDLTLLLDVRPELGLARARALGPEDRFEREAADFFERVRTAYLARASDQPRRFEIINAGQQQQEVIAQINTVIAQRLQEWC